LSGVDGEPNRLEPAEIGAGAAWDWVECGYSFGCAVRVDGSVHCFGSNNSAELGQGDTEPRAAPTLVLMP
jgi:alpha-tubulin suppressor-like RCC1 family protein